MSIPDARQLLAKRLEDDYLFQIKAAGISDMPVREFKPFENRRFRLDFSWPDKKIAVEIMGGVHGDGRHVRPAGYQSDCDKLNRLSLEGWDVYYFTNQHLRNGEALRITKEALLK